MLKLWIKSSARLFFFSLIFFFGAVAAVYPQAYHFKIYSVNHGLPHGQVSDIIQASDGYIWLGTSGGGLVKFNGKHFQPYTIQDGLKDDLVNFVFEDSKNQLWSATYNGGVALLDKNRFIYPFEGEEIEDVYVISMKEDLDGNYWFLTYQNGIFIHDGESFTRITVDDGLPDNTVWDLQWDDNYIWIASNGGLSRYDGESIQSYTTDDGLSGERVYKIAESENGEFWLATSNGVTIYDKEGGFEIIESIDGRRLSYIYDLFIASNGDVWIGTENDGVYRYDGERYTHMSISEGLSSNYIYRIYEDSEGYIWLATDENGVSIYRGGDFRFYTTENGLNSNLIYDLHLSSTGTMWIGTDRGLMSYRNGVFSSVSVPANLSNRRHIWDITEDLNGDLLIITYDNRLLRFDGISFWDITDKLGHDDLYIYDLKVDSKGNIWVATDYELLKYDGSTTVIYGLEDGMPGSIVYHLYEDDDVIWAATNNGVARIDGDNITAITSADGLGHYNVNHITKQQDGTLWFGTSSGVTLYRPGKGSGQDELVNFGREDGMNLVESTFLWYDEEAGQLWQGTSGGIHRLDVRAYNETGTMYISHYGLSSKSTGVRTSHKAVETDRDGRVWYGTDEGIILYHPNDQMDIRTPGKLFLTGIRINGMEPEWDDKGGQLEHFLGRKLYPETAFPYGRNSYQFEFSALEFLDPGNLDYRYRIEGFDQDWHRSEGLNYAFYTNLSPGDYKFEVQARIGNGPWSEPLQYMFTVQTPYWLAPWFWILILVTVAGTVYGFIHFRVQVVERRKLEELVDIQTESLRKTLNEREILLKEVHHRVKNNLAVIYSLLELQTYNTDNEETAGLLRESSLRVHSIALVHEKLYQNDDLAYIHVNKYIPDLVDSIAQSFGEKSDNVEINMDIDDVTLSLQEGIPCGLMLNELITNAFKHAFISDHQGKLLINIKEKNDELMMEVSDNGPGLPEDFEVKKTTTLGITLIRSLSVQLKGDLKVRSDENGATFKLTFNKNEVK